ncbi:MAG: response regulator [Planctomycetota bacterium]
MTPPAPPKHRILVVDDEESILRAIKRVLRRAKYDVDIAPNGMEAVELFKQNSYAVIVCDQRMPEMSGAEVLSQAYKLTPDTYRITLTGYTDLSSAQQSINEGKVQQFLTKPWSDENLLTVVEMGVKSYDLINDNRRLTKEAEEHQKKLEEWNKQLEEQVEKRTAALKLQTEKLQKITERLELSLRDTVDVILGILDAVDANVAAHSRRVADLGTEIAKSLGLDKEQTKEVEYVALLHDVGRIADLHSHAGPKKPKPSKGSVYETGYALLSRVRGFESIAKGVRCVPAKYDGKGEPKLQRNAIPLPARIVAVANAFDCAAFSPSQPTKPRAEDGHRALEAGSGTQFDPEIIAALLDDSVDSRTTDAHEVELSTKKLEPGMIISRDVTNAQGILMLSVGTPLTEATIKKLRELAQAQILTRGVFVKCENEPDESASSEAA